MSQLFDFLLLGGPLMVPIGLGSVIAATLFFERLLFLRSPRMVPAAWTRTALEHLRTQKWDEALNWCGQSDTPMSRLTAVAIRHRGLPRAEVKEIMAEHAEREVARLESNVALLSAVVTISPLLGLLGTVTGMIKTFQSVSASAALGDVATGALASGIWEALITTAAGLSVAIPAFVAHRIVVSRIETVTFELDSSLSDVLDLVAARPPVAP